ncbi:MAG TPA: serine/threonine-protein kinase [Anaerolineae bacterium]|nr:serine/threonine-protein kinase [Anaerolineae bacterium]
MTTHWTPLAPGQEMRGGAYRILRRLGAGGMGALYLAADTGAFDRTCVVKELLDYYDPTNAEEARRAEARFETEARLLAQLSHPGIPRIYSYFTEAGRHYIVMEYIEGDTLELAVTHLNEDGRRVPARALPAETIVRHVITVCRVLEYLGSRPTPVIHHDIKPANLIADRTSGEVRLVDFGTAQVRTSWAAQSRAGRALSSVFGTQGYAAPEQFEGKSEPRSDTFALAATAYHLLTDDDPGDHPFQFPKLNKLPAALGDALGRALRPKVRRRSSAVELRHALEAWLIPEDGAEPFVFRDGAVAHTTEELVALCEQRWAEARKHLRDGDLDRWFRTRNRHDLLAKANSARLEADPDAALESFLRLLNPRLPAPRLAVEPASLSFGRVTRRAVASQRLVIRNVGRGYGQVGFTASVPWLDFEPRRAGCLAGQDASVQVLLDTGALPLKQDHQAVIACISARGQRISIPVEAQLSLWAEAASRVGSALARAARLSFRGVRWGLAQWHLVLRQAFRMKVGPWVLVAAVLAFAALGAIFLADWRAIPLGAEQAVKDFLRALPFSVLGIYLAPALLFAVAGIAREALLLVRRRRAA